MLSSQLLFRKYGWAKALYIFPRYRYLTSVYNFDDYSSKGSAVYPVKKNNRAMAAIEAAPGSDNMAVDSKFIYHIFFFHTFKGEKLRKHHVTDDFIKKFSFFSWKC